MALDQIVLKERMEEAFGSDTQEKVANKLSTTQGNISKLLAGQQMPTLELVYLISENYRVSVDWLLGLTEQKQPFPSGSYASMVDELIQMDRRNRLYLQEGKVCSGDSMCNMYQATMDDSILSSLLKTAIALARADWDSYVRWRDEKLVRYRHTKLGDIAGARAIARGNGKIISSGAILEPRS